MSTSIFVDLLAYAAADMGVLVLLYLGVAFMRPSSAVKGLAAFIGDDRARECFSDGSFKPGHAKVLGSIFLLLAAFIAICIVRGIWH